MQTDYSNINLETYTRKLKVAISERGIEQKLIANTLAISKSAFSQIVRGYRLPNIRQFFEICRILKVHAHFFIFEDSNFSDFDLDKQSLHENIDIAKIDAKIDERIDSLASTIKVSLKTEILKELTGS